MSSTIFFFLFIPLLAFILLAINLIFAPHNAYMEKNSVFECGFTSFLGQNRTQFSVSFFIFALLFLLFDLEILLVYPYLVSGYVNEIYGLTILLIFLLALTLGFAFELGKKALSIDSRQMSNRSDNVPTKVSSYMFSRKNKFLGIKLAVVTCVKFIYYSLTVSPSKPYAFVSLPKQSRVSFTNILAKISLSKIVSIMFVAFLMTILRYCLYGGLISNALTLYEATTWACSGALLKYFFQCFFNEVFLVKMGTDPTLGDSIKRLHAFFAAPAKDSTGSWGESSTRSTVGNSTGSSGGGSYTESLEGGSTGIFGGFDGNTIDPRILLEDAELIKRARQMEQEKTREMEQEKIREVEQEKIREAEQEKIREAEQEKIREAEQEKTWEVEQENTWEVEQENTWEVEQENTGETRRSTRIAENKAKQNRHLPENEPRQILQKRHREEVETRQVLQKRQKTDDESPQALQNRQRAESGKWSRYILPSRHGKDKDMQTRQFTQEMEHEDIQEIEREDIQELQHEDTQGLEYEDTQELLDRRIRHYNETNKLMETKERMENEGKARRQLAGTQDQAKETELDEYTQFLLDRRKREQIEREKLMETKERMENEGKARRQLEEE